MSASNFFSQYARELARQKEGQFSVLLQRRDELRLALAKTEADLTEAQGAATRASIYPVTGGADLCPVCWINNQSVAVRPMGGGTDSFDRFRCGTCNSKFEVPFR